MVKKALLILCFVLVVTPMLHAQSSNGFTSATPRRGSDPAVAGALAGPVPVGGPWIEFSFGATGSMAAGCSPADPGAPACAPSSGANSVFGGTPPWTFVAPAGGAQITVTDAFLRGDRFEIFDFGVSIGTTSVPVASGACGDDPDPCVLDPQVSHAIFPVGPGSHSITIRAIASPFGAGAAYFRIDGAAQALDHYLCYDVKWEGEFRPRKVNIRNQFERKEYIVVAPHMLCVPSAKTLLE